MRLPSVYFASKLYRGPQWRQMVKDLSSCINVVSTWHSDHDVIANEAHDAVALRGWIDNRTQVVKLADYVLAHGIAGDPLNGTLIEIGMAIGRGIPVVLVGDYPWGTWKLLPNVTHVESLDAAVAFITKDDPNAPR
jgi:nucleoside 2-deoxyribosyltransferase